jgi:hypothetical protein
MHPGQSQYWEAISSFLAAFTKEPPWYFSLNKIVKTNDPNGTFFQVLGLSNKGGIALCKAAGLVSIRILKGTPVMRVEHEQWRNLLRDSDLCDSTDYNPTQLNKKDLVFINLGKKNIAARGLYNTPHQQYKKSPPKLHYRLHVQQRQLRLALESLARHYNTPDVLPQHRELAYTVLSRNIQSAFDDSSDSEDESEGERDEDNEQKSSSDQNTEGGEAPKEEEKFDFGFTNTPINQSTHPLLSKIVA